MKELFEAVFIAIVNIILSHELSYKIIWADSIQVGFNSVIACPPCVQGMQDTYILCDPWYSRANRRAYYGLFSDRLLLQPLPSYDY